MRRKGATHPSELRVECLKSPGSIGAKRPNRLAFKLEQHGLRKDTAEVPGISFEPPADSEALARSYTERRSYRRFVPDPVPVESLGRLLACLRQIQPEGAMFPKYRYGSAGGLYPVQTYVHAKAGRVDGLEEGTYYYHPVEHRLVTLKPGVRLEADLHLSVNTPVFEACAFTISW